MTDMRNPTPSPQDDSTLPQQPHEGCTGYAEDELREKARQAGEVEIDELHPCCDCPVYMRGEQNNDPQCETCLVNPNLDPNFDVQRLGARIIQSIFGIGFIDCKRLTAGTRLDDPAYLAECAKSMDDLNDDCERLFTILIPPDAEAIAEEHQVAEVLEGGGQ